MNIHIKALLLGTLFFSAFLIISLGISYSIIHFGEYFVPLIITSLVVAIVYTMGRCIIEFIEDYNEFS